MTLTIQLTDSNDNSPVFTPLSYTFNLDENTPTDPVVYIGNVSASDIDSRINGEVGVVNNGCGEWGMYCRKNI